MSSPLPLLVKALEAIDAAVAVTDKDSPRGRGLSRKEAAKVLHLMGDVMHVVADMLGK